MHLKCVSSDHLWLDVEGMVSDFMTAYTTDYLTVLLCVGKTFKKNKNGRKNTVLSIRYLFKLDIIGKV